MTLGELHGIIEEMLEEHGEDVPVRLAVQPDWPLSHTVANVRYLNEDDCPAQAQPAAVWIAASQGHPCDESPYAPREAWDEE